MWVFLSGGMMMPALIPPSVLAAAKTADIQEAVERGWELQVRGRVKEHLDWFAETYMTPGSYSVTYVVKDKDYQARFYTTRSDFGDALAMASLDMNYTKFKDTANKFPWGKKYHDLLLRVWSASASIFGAGGFYGDYSRENPRGRLPKKRGNPRKDWGRYDRPIGSTFLDTMDDGHISRREDELDLKPLASEVLGDWWNDDDEPEWAHRKSIHNMTDAELEEFESRF